MDKKALIYSVSGIGNTISSLPLINALFELNYKIDIALDFRRNAQQIYLAHPQITNVFDISTQYNFKFKKYDDVFHCSYCDKPMVTSELHSAKNHTIPPFCNPPEIVRFSFEKHEADYFLDMARNVGWNGTVKQVLPYIDTSIDIPKNCICISTGYFKGDVNSKTKHWGNKNFINLALTIYNKGYIPLFLGNQEDWESDAKFIVSEIQKTNPSIPLHFYNQNLLESYGILNKCIAYVGNETSMVPAAAALDKPTISLIFKDVHKHLFAPVKNHPFPNGLAIICEKNNISINWLVDKLITRINGDKVERIIYL
jgi:ADP-heptose:LPS heptosyltransferase